MGNLLNVRHAEIGSGLLVLCFSVALIVMYPVTGQCYCRTKCLLKKYMIQVVFVDR